jgi:iron complex outermembrane receptor protein
VGGALEFESALEMVEANFADGGDVPLVPPLTLRLEGAVDWTWMRAALSATFAAEQDVPGEGFLPVERYEVFDADFEVPLKLASSAKSALFLQVRNIGDVEVRYATSVLRDLAPQPGRSLRAGVRLGF